MDSENGEQQPEVKQEEQEDKVEPVYMFYCYTDQTTGQSQWYMLPEYIEFFNGMLGMIETMEGTTGKKWTSEEVEKYFLFLNDLKNYIIAYIFPGYVNDFNVFMDAMNKYGEDQNPIGFQLYNHQVEYLEAKAQGKHFKIEKKAKKAPEPPKKEKVPPKEVKEEEPVRKEDPTITAQELISKQLDQAKFTADLSAFKKETGNLIFIGHVDSGKSTLTGNIMKELKQIDEQELQRNKQEAKETHMEAWELAFIADVDPNERKRGKTVQCSKMMFTLENRRYTLFDAPGHKGYVPNMMMGACQADIAVLIISAKDGEFEAGFEKEGQTKEHAMLATALGVQKMIAVVTKMGTVNWSQERFNLIKTQVTPFLESSCGFTQVQFIPIDSINNVNIHSRQEGNTWYNGPSLIEVLNTVPIPKREPDGPLRIPVVDKFKDVGNFYLYGKVESGKIAYENQVVSLLPRRVHFTIKEIFNARDEKLPYALAGENVKLRIKGLDEDEVHRGDIICSNSNFCQESMEFKANLTVLELPEHKKLVSSGYECVIHMHAISEEAEISLVEAKIEKQTRKVLKATFLRTGETGKVVIKLRNSVCMEKFDFMPTLGRFTLRDEGKTIGFGEVTKIKPAKALLKEQKEQLGMKSEVDNLTEGVKKVQISQ